MVNILSVIKFNVLFTYKLYKPLYTGYKQKFERVLSNFKVDRSSPLCDIKNNDVVPKKILNINMVFLPRINILMK